MLTMRRLDAAQDHVGSLVAKYAGALPPPRAPQPGRIQNFGDLRLAAPAPGMHICIAGRPSPPSRPPASRVLPDSVITSHFGITGFAGASPGGPSAADIHFAGSPPQTPRTAAISDCVRLCIITPAGITPARCLSGNSHRASHHGARVLSRGGENARRARAKQSTIAVGPLAASILRQGPRHTVPWGSP